MPNRCAALGNCNRCAGAIASGLCGDTIGAKIALKAMTVRNTAENAAGDRTRQPSHRGHGVAAAAQRHVEPQSA